MRLLRLFTGEIVSDEKNLRDSRRMFVDEFLEEEQEELLDFFSKNKTLILTDVLKGRGKFSAEWMLVVLKNEK